MTTAQSREQHRQALQSQREQLAAQIRQAEDNLLSVADPQNLKLLDTRISAWRSELYELDQQLNAVVVETQEEFAERHGDAVYVRHRWVYEDGAQHDGRLSQEPPSDPNALLALRHEYFRAKADAAIKRFDHDRTCIQTQLQYHASGCGPMPPARWEEHLEKLAKEIEQLEQQAAELREQLPNFKARQAYAERRNEERQRASEAFGVLQQLPVF